MTRIMKSSLVLATLFLIGTTVSAVQNKMTLQGYLMDRACAAGVLKSDDKAAAAKKHTKDCALSCADSGFGVLAGDKYYRFDDHGNKLAEALLKATKKSSDISVEVTGSLKGDVLAVDSLSERE